MAEQIKAGSAAAPFDYELYEGNPDELTTVDATPAKPNIFIDPSSLKFKYRIGHGLFGDVWLATHHQSAKEFDEYHEVAVKMLHPLNKDHVKEFLRKFEKLWASLKSKELQGVCWLHGISVINDKICIAMRPYEGLIGDRMGRLRRRKLPLSDVLRYSIELAKGIQQLHQIGVLVLNLKPTNFLLDGSGHIVLGDFGIPYLLLGFSWSDSHLAFRLGTPNYMAPEQWEPGVRGPISYETDSWGFACSIIEMLTGITPWFGRSVEEIRHAVVIHREKPQVPSGLPGTLEDVLKGCFEYDFRNRPLMQDILKAFESSRSAVHIHGPWSGFRSNVQVKFRCSGHSSWFLSKDHLQVGDAVRPRKFLETCQPQIWAVTEGLVVGLEKDNNNRDGFALVQNPYVRKPTRINVLALERVTSGFSAGDWVRLIKTNEHHSSRGILHSIQRDGTVLVGLLGLETLWEGHSSDIQRVEPFSVGQFVRLKANITTPKFEWPHKRGRAWACGKISHIFPNGCLEIKFPGRFAFGDEHTSFLASPEEVERVSFDTCQGIVEKYEHVEDFHWAIRPLTIAVGLLTATKIGIAVGRNISARIEERKRIQKQKEEARRRWLPPKVADIFFKEG